MSDLSVAPSLTEPTLDRTPLLDDGATDTRLDRARPGEIGFLRETCEDAIAILKRDNDAADAAIAATPIPGDIVRLRHQLAQRSGLTELEVNQLVILAREAIERLTERHHRGLDSVGTLLGVLDEIGASPEVEDGHVHVACLSVADAMRIGGDLRQHAPQLADAIIDASRYDKLSGHLWWDCKAIEREAA